jgi:hypothetical protein
LFVADSTVGQYQVIAQETLAHRADTATVQIFAPLAQIQVRPDSVQLAPNETQQFTAQGYDALGNTVPAFVRWSATGGTITVSGLYTADSDSGLYVIQAIDTLASIRGWTNVRIVSITRVDDKVQIPEEFFLSQNFPNPFNPTTTIKFGIKESGHVRLSVFDIRGRWVATLLDDHLQMGRYDIRFDASALASGLYFYRLESRTFSETKKMILLE